MSVGATHVICISQSKAYVFGDNSFGQCGVGANENVRTPTMLLKGKYIMSAAASKKTSFFVSWTGSVYACGTSDFGNLGLNSSTESYQISIPEKILNLPEVNFVAAGATHTVAIDLKTQGMYGWGNTMNFKLGVEDLTSILTPQKISFQEKDQPKFIHLACGNQFTIAIDDNFYV